MLEKIITIARNLLQPEEETAGQVMENFPHGKFCPAYGKDIADSAEYLQIGIDKEWVPTAGGTWGMSFGGYVNVTYIRCTSCDVKKVFQER